MNESGEWTSLDSRTREAPRASDSPMDRSAREETAASVPPAPAPAATGAVPGKGGAFAPSVSSPGASAAAGSLRDALFAAVVYAVATLSVLLAILRALPFGPPADAAPSGRRVAVVANFQAGPFLEAAQKSRAVVLPSLSAGAFTEGAYASSAAARAAELDVRKSGVPAAAVKDGGYYYVVLGPAAVPKANGSFSAALRRAEVPSFFHLFSFSSFSIPLPQYTPAQLRAAELLTLSDSQSMVDLMAKDAGLAAPQLAQWEGAVQKAAKTLRLLPPAGPFSGRLQALSKAVAAATAGGRSSAMQRMAALDRCLEAYSALRESL